jgi:hypothetical protein
MKSEPHGTFNIDTTNVKRFGLENLDPIQLQIISSMVTAKPITSTEAAMTCLGIPIVQRSSAVIYINSKPPNMRTNYITRSQILSIHSTMTYTHGHLDFEQLPFKAYFKKYELVKDCFISDSRTYIEIDSIGNHLYKNTKVIRFTYYNPSSNVESFFYNIPFRDELDLFSTGNTRHSYILECKLHGLLDDVESLLHYVLEYSQRNLYDKDRYNHLVDQILLQYPYLYPLRPSATQLNP